MMVTPSRAAALATSRSLAAWGSMAMIVPRFSMSWARWVALVPGAAQVSATTSPGRGARRRATSIEASSCTVQAPSVKAFQRPGMPRSTTSPSGASAVGRASAISSSRSRAATMSREQRSVLARTVSGGRSQSAAIRASASWRPYRAIQRAASQSGKDQRTPTAATGESGAGGGAGVRVSERSTALTNSAGPGLRDLSLARLTASSTAAQRGTRSRKRIWYAVRRRRARTHGSSLVKGRCRWGPRRQSRCRCQRRAP